MSFGSLTSPSLESQVWVRAVRLSSGWLRRSVADGISADLNIVGRYEVIRKARLASILSILALRHSPKSEWKFYVGVEHSFLGYRFSTGEVSSLFSSRVAKSLHSGSERWCPSLLVM